MSGWKEPETIIAAVSAACAIAVFAFGVREYQSSDNWKRSEFVAAQIKEFNSDKINQSVLRMMDYDPARIELFPDRRNLDQRYVNVPFGTLVSAIDKEKNFSDTEFQVRQYFEHFLTALSRFNYFLESGAIEASELCPDFAYPVSLMTGDAQKKKLENSRIDITPFSKAVSSYLDRWDHKYGRDFLQKIRKACP